MSLHQNCVAVFNLVPLNNPDHGRIAKQEHGLLEHISPRLNRFGAAVLIAHGCGSYNLNNDICQFANRRFGEYRDEG